MIGSRKTSDILRKAGLNDAQLRTVKSGEDILFKSFRVRVIESKHGTTTPGKKPEFQEIKKDFKDAGDSYLYYFTFGRLRLLHQSTGGFIKEELTGLRPNIALLYPMERKGTEIMLKALRPKTVFVHHFDQWRTPYSDGI